ncbi:MAG TPA: hypothetical protein VHT92_01250 [Candidatus Cybelea sp.]|nr:hypothetical protein [Candidatus Cybelea sp.]
MPIRKLVVVAALLAAAVIPAQRAIAQSVPLDTPVVAPQLQETATPAPATSVESPAPATPGESPASAAPAAPAKITKDQINAMMKRSNPRFNPCGGWRQLLTSYAAATNCSLDAGQFTLGVNYAATYIPLGTKLTINGATATSTTYSVTHSFPAATLSVGLGGLWTLLYTPPEHSDSGGYYGNVNSSGTTNQMFGFRNMFYFNRCFPYCGGFGLSAINFFYKPPTGSEALRGIGPSYTAGFSTSVTVAHAPSGAGRWIINLWDPVTYGVISSQSGTKGQPGTVQWGVSSTLLATAIWIHHSWRLNTSIGYLIPAHQWVFNVNPNYLISRRLVVGADYGGAGVALQNVSAPPILLSNTTTRPRFLDVTLMYLLGPTYGQFHDLPEPPPGD